MSRGMVNGEQIVSQAGTDAYRDNYDRIFGKDHKPQRGHWSFGEADASERAVNAPIIADRIHEGTVSPIDGSDIGSRRRRREHMRAHGVEDASDCSRSWLQNQQRERERHIEQRIDGAFDQAARKLHNQGKLRD